VKKSFIFICWNTNETLLWRMEVVAASAKQMTAAARSRLHFGTHIVNTDVWPVKLRHVTWRGPATCSGEAEMLGFTSREANGRLQKQIWFERPVALYSDACFLACQTRNSIKTVLIDNPLKQNFPWS
jgi:hypothetical protein